MDDISAKLYAIVDALGPLYDCLPDRILDSRERGVCSSSVYPEAGNFVRATAQALDRPDGLFAGIPLSGETLLACQRNADALKVVINQLRILGRLAGDSFIRYQSVAVVHAQQVHDWAAQQADDPFAPLRGPLREIDQQREIALAGAAKYAQVKGCKRSRKGQGQEKRSRKKRDARRSP